jgi:hypothetical protein
VATNDPTTAHFTAIKTWEAQVQLSRQRTAFSILQHKQCKSVNPFPSIKGSEEKWSQYFEQHTTTA